MSTIQQPSLEKIEPTYGQSFTMKQFSEGTNNAVPFWHFHPELEIVYIEDGSGKRHIGNHISYYQGGDLILLGPNLPHYGFTDRFTGMKSEIVIQMKEDFLGTKILDIPETGHIKKLFQRSISGLTFHGNTKQKVGERLTNMFHMTPFERLIEFVKVLDILASSDEYSVLNAESVNLIVNPKDSARIDTIYKYVREHFTDEEMPLKNVASLINMTVPSFCRYFKKHTNKTFTEFLNEFRVVHATKLLAETDLPISSVCFDSGFNNFSHFNRHFKKITGTSPSDYRKNLEPVSVIKMIS